MIMPEESLLNYPFSIFMMSAMNIPWYYVNLIMHRISYISNLGKVNVIHTINMQDILHAVRVTAIAGSLCINVDYEHLFCIPSGNCALYITNQWNHWKHCK